MSVTQQEITQLRAQLAEDRKLCANSDLAQKYLDGAETKLDEVESSWARLNPLEALNGMLDEAQVGTDTANSEELRAMVSDLAEWEEALENIPAENRTTPLYALSEKFLWTLKQNYVALYQKNRLADLMSAEVAPLENTVKE